MNGIDRGLNEVDDIEIRKLGWACLILRVEGERIPSEKKKQIFNEKIRKKIYNRESKKKMGQSCPEGCIAVPRNNRFEELSKEYRKVGVP